MNYYYKHDVHILIITVMTASITCYIIKSSIHLLLQKMNIEKFLIGIEW